MRQQSDAEKDELYKYIGQVKEELDSLKKELAGLIKLTTSAHPHLSIQQQCELLGVPRSSYYQPQPESGENLCLLRQLDQLYMKRPFYAAAKWPSSWT